ncbi:MAG: hypothetical protein SWH54_09370 [Thermodesulfobacteriota bacterium]|nr:hypothetical protein [Thermodesulfobacteriota bacterium]
MSLVETNEKNNAEINSYPLSNVQMELLKLYSTNLKETDLEELKKVLANHFAGKATKEADQIWKQKKMSTDTMEKWLNEE